MKLSQIRPFVRFARIQSTIPLWEGAIGCDNRIFVCLSGGGVITVDGVDFTLERGTVIGWRAGMTYAYHPNEDGMVLVGCNYDLTDCTGNIVSPLPPCRPENYTPDRLTEPSYIIEDALSISGAFAFKATGDIVEKMKLINLEYSNRLIHSAERCSALLYDVLVQCARLSYKSLDAGNSIAETVIAYVSSHLGERLTNASVAAELNYHPNYVSRVMKQLTGMSLHAYVIDRRISESIGLLESTDIPVTEIALSTGFCDVRHFSKIFRQKTGKCPSDFRTK